MLRWFPRTPLSRHGLHPAWLIALVLFWVLGGCAGQAIRSDLSEAEQREDLEYLATVFAQREQSFTPESRASFQARLVELDSRLGSMSHAEFIAGIQKAVVAADNGHTEALTHEHQRLRLPIDVEWFPDGLFVIATRPGYEELLGARVEAIEGRSPDAILAVLASYAPGTDEHVRVISGYFFERPELLAAIGEAGNTDRLTITLALPGGQELTWTLPGRWGNSTDRSDDARRVLDSLDLLPLYLREPGKSAFIAWLAESDAVYIRINDNYNKTLPIELDDILAEIEKKAPRNAIVDLRLNGGGNYELTAPFAEALPGLLPDNGRLVLIVGHRTFSAAIITAAILKVRAGEQAIIVGEKIGDDLQFWSEGGLLTLPNSGLRIHFSDGYHDWRDGYDPADPRNRANPRIAAVNKRYSVAARSLDPAVSIPLTFHDYAEGRDPVMEEITSLLSTTAP